MKRKLIISTLIISIVTQNFALTGITYANSSSLDSYTTIESKDEIVQNENNNETAEEDATEVEEGNNNEITEEDATEVEEENNNEITEEDATEIEEGNNNEITEEDATEVQEENNNEITEEDATEVQEGNNNEITEEDATEVEEENNNEITEEDVTEVEEENIEEAEELTPDFDSIESEADYIKDLHKNGEINTSGVTTIDPTYLNVSFRNFNDERGVVTGYRIIVDGVDRGIVHGNYYSQNAAMYLDLSRSGIYISRFSELIIYAVTDNGEYYVFGEDKSSPQYLAAEKAYIEELRKGAMIVSDFVNSDTFDAVVFKNFKFDNDYMVNGFKLVVNGRNVGTVRNRGSERINIEEFYGRYYRPGTDGNVVQVYALVYNGEYLLCESFTEEDFVKNYINNVKIALPTTRGMYGNIIFNNTDYMGNKVRIYLVKVDGEYYGGLRSAQYDADKGRDIINLAEHGGKEVPISSEVEVYIYTDKTIFDDPHKVFSSVDYFNNEREYIEKLHKDVTQVVSNIEDVRYISAIKFAEFNDSKNLVNEYKLVVDGVDYGFRTEFTGNDTRTINVSSFVGDNLIEYGTDVQLYASTGLKEYLVFETDYEDLYIEELHKDATHISNYVINPGLYNKALAQIRFNNFADTKNLVNGYRMVIDGVDMGVRKPVYKSIEKRQVVTPREYNNRKDVSPFSEVLVYAVTDKGEYLVFGGEDRTTVEYLAQEKRYVEDIHNNAKAALSVINGVTYYSRVEFNDFADSKDLVKQYRLVVDGVDMGLQPVSSYGHTANYRQLFFTMFTGRNKIKHESKIELYAVTNQGEYLVLED